MCLVTCSKKVGSHDMTERLAIYCLIDLISLVKNIEALPIYESFGAAIFY